MTNDYSFPNAFSMFTGNGKAGVKQVLISDPFLNEFHINTSLTDRIKNLLQEHFCKNGSEEKNIPRVILLVGGPGNGKTETIDGILLYILKEFCGEFECDPIELLPEANINSRSFEFSTNKFINPKGLNHRRFIIVTDASQPDPTKIDKLPAQLLLDDITRVLDDNNKDLIYLCCLNKGVLGDALQNLSKEEYPENIKKIIKNTDIATSIRADPISCWPLSECNEVCIWPMDVESLATEINGGKSVLENLLEKIAQENLWDERIISNEKNPFLYNKKILQDENCRKSLVKILRWYEYAAGRRLTFRDLFSIFHYLFAYIPHSDKLSSLNSRRKKQQNSLDTIQGNYTVWAETALKIIQDEEKEKKLRYTTLFELMGCIYHQKLFSFNFSENEVKAVEYALKKFKLNSSDEDITLCDKVPCSLIDSYDDAKVFLKCLLDYIKSNTRLDTNLISNIPLYCQKHISSLNDQLSPTEYSDSKLDDLYKFFSLSIKDGVEKCQTEISHISEIEKIVMNCLSIVESIYDKQSASKDQNTILKFIKTVACRIIRKSDSAQNATVKHCDLFSSYELLIVQGANSSPQKQYRDIREKLRNLINTRTVNGADYKFIEELNKTFGQPSLSAHSKVYVIANKCNVKEHKQNAFPNNSCPSQLYPFFDIRVNNENIITLPLTFEHYKAINMLIDNLSPAALSRSVIAHIDKCKALVLGKYVRVNDDDADNYDVYIKIGQDKIKLNETDFVLEEGN